MNKTFIGSAPLQPPKPVRYSAVDNSHLQYDDVVLNPLCLLLRGYAKPGDQVKIIVCVTEGTVAEENFLTLREDFLKIGKEIGFIPEIIACNVKNDEGIATHAALLSDLAALAGENQTFYVDITFGTKPTPIVFFNFLRFVTQVYNAGIGCVCYGRMEHSQPGHPGYIYDVSALYMMTTIIDKVAKQSPQNSNTLFQLLLTGMKGS